MLSAPSCLFFACLLFAHDTKRNPHRNFQTNFYSAQILRVMAQTSDSVNNFELITFQLPNKLSGNISWESLDIFIINSNSYKIVSLVPVTTEIISMCQLNLGWKPLYGKIQ